MEKFEKEGQAFRDDGGAFLKNVEDQVRSFSLAYQQNIDKKEMIGKKMFRVHRTGGYSDIRFGFNNNRNSEEAKSE